MPKSRNFSPAFSGSLTPAATNDYVKYVDRIKTNLKNNLSTNEAVEEALDWAIKENFLEGLFREQRAEVLAMSIFEFDKELYDKCRRREGYNEGLEAGAQQKAEEAAINLLRMRLGTPEQIAQAQGLPLEKVLELQKSVLVET